MLENQKSPNNIQIGCIWKCYAQFSRNIFHFGRVGGVWTFDHPVYDYYMDVDWFDENWLFISHTNGHSSIREIRAKEYHTLHFRVMW